MNSIVHTVKCLPFKAGALILVLFGYPAISISTDIPIEQTFRYSIHYQGIDAGEIVYTIHKQGPEYLVRAVSEPSFLASLFLDDTTTEFRYRLEDGGIALLSGREIERKTGTIKRHFKINHVTQEILFSQHKRGRFEMGTEIDTFPLPFAVLLSGFVPGKEVLYVSFKRSYPSVIKQVKQTTITISDDTLNALLIEHVAPDNPDHVFRLWLGLDDLTVPVRIESGRHNHLNVMELLP